MSVTFASELNKMITAGMGGAVSAPATHVAVGYTSTFETESGAVVTFDAPTAEPLKELTVTLEPVQEGSGDPAPDNVRPITGHSSVTVTRAGKNLFDPNSTEKKWVNLDGTVSDRPSVKSRTLPATAGTQFTLSNANASSATNVLLLSFFDASGGMLSRAPKTDGLKYVTATAPENTAYAIASFFTWAEVSEAQLEAGSSATAYEAYKGTTYTADLDATYYGGTLDVISGALTVTYGVIDSYNGETLPGEWISDRDVYAAGTTPTTGAQVVYELAEPTTVQLTAQDVSALQGTNNIWSDSGDVTVVWKKVSFTEGY